MAKRVQAHDTDDERRSLLTLLGGALGVAALAGCSKTEAAEEREKLSQLTNAVVGTSIRWVNKIGTAAGWTAGDDSLRDITGSQVGDIVVATGFWNHLDGGGGLFRWGDGVDNGGTVIVPRTNSAGTYGAAWRRLYSGPLDVKWFGARGNNVANDQPYIQAAINALTGSGANLSSSTLFIPGGTYLLFPDSAPATELLGVTRQIRILGEGMGTILKASGAAVASRDIIRVYRDPNDLEFVTLERFQIQSEPATAPAGNGIHISLGAVANVSRMEVKSVYIGETGGVGIKVTRDPDRLDGFFTSVIRDCAVYGGIHFENSGDSVLIENCTITDKRAGRVGVRVRVGWSSSGQVGSQTTIRDCNITTPSSCVVLEQGSLINVVNNNMEVVGQSGAGPVIVVDDVVSTDTKRRLVGVNIVGNLLSRFGADISYAVDIGRVDRALLEHNTILRGDSGTRVIVRSGATNTVIGQNRYEDPNAPAVAVSHVEDAGRGTAGVFRAAALASGWTVWNSTSPGYVKDANGVVTLQGTVTKASPTPADPIFTLDIGFRPDALRQFPVVCAASGGSSETGIVSIDETGVVRRQSGGTSEFFSLDGISFRASPVFPAV